jgi:YYY domain-containing protein
VIDDDRAEEAFTVYDHPKVLIFQKQPDFSPQRVRQILSAVPLDNVVQLTPIQVGKPNGMLPESLRQADVAGGTWTDEFALDGPAQPAWDRIANRLAPLLWLLAVEAIGLLAAPLVWAVCHRLPDRGIGLAKGAGLLAVSWFAWSLSGYRLLPWTRLTIVIAVLALAACSAHYLHRRGAAFFDWVRAHRRLLVAGETLFLVAFIAFTLVRMFNPDLWHPARGGEKPMEFSYLNAVIKTAYFPPYDPWYAGGYLNYYYFGYVLVAALSKLTGVMPSIAFNLAVPTLYAFTAAGAFSFVYNLSRLGGRPGFTFKAAVAAGVAGFALVAVAGNLDGWTQLTERLSHAAGVTQSLTGTLAGAVAVLLGGKQIEPFDFWRSSRIIPNNTINEFPFWTFLFSDLHAHLISIPFQVLTAGWLLNLAYGGLRVDLPGNPSAPNLIRGPVRQGPLPWVLSLLGWRRLIEIGVTGWLLGALYVINTWEFPTYLLLAASVFVIAEFTAQRGLTLGGLARAVVSAGGAFVLAKPLFKPFWSYYFTVYSAVTPWTQDKSTLGDYLTIHGLFVFLLATLIVLLGWPRWKHTGWMRYVRARWRWLGAWERFGELEEVFFADRRSPATGYLSLWAVGGVLTLGFLLRGLPLVAFLCAMHCATVAAAWVRRDSPALLTAALLAATGFALGIFVEFYALQGDIGRMNTVFKFYLQVWVMWGLVSAAALVWAIDRIWASRTMPAPAAVPAAAPRFPGRPLLWDNPVAAGAGDGDGVEWAAGRVQRSSMAGTVAPPAPAATRDEETADDEWDEDGAEDAEDAEGDAERSRRPRRRRRARLAGASAAGASWTFGIGWPQWAWLGAAGALLLAVLAYPLGATPSRIADRFNPLPPTLDGMAYMPHATIQDTNSEVTANGHPGGITISGAADYAAIRWLLENVHGSPVILEASIPEYRWGSRIAKYTGLPAVLGWRWHQAQQRGTYAPLVDQRLRDVQTMFNDPSPSRVLPLLEKYRVRYIYVGDLERGYYSRSGLAKFDQMTDSLRPVYQQDGVTIYEVLNDV